MDKSDQRQYDIFNTIDSAINLAYYQSDAAKVREIREFVEKRAIADKEKLLLYIDAVLADIDNNSEELSPDKFAKLADLLFNFTDFDETKLRIYINLMPFYDLKSNLIICKKFIVKLQVRRIRANKLNYLLQLIIFCLIALSRTRTLTPAFLLQQLLKLLLDPNCFSIKCYDCT